ncbi:UNVERIFIED_CONTAM: hypothetical protein GTU68_057536 [Idotea baltica]|nr:hypothetical protein [Idotea baltica]
MPGTSWSRKRPRPKRSSRRLTAARTSPSWPGKSQRDRRAPTAAASATSPRGRWCRPSRKPRWPWIRAATPARPWRPSSAGMLSSSKTSAARKNRLWKPLPTDCASS